MNTHFRSSEKTDLIDAALLKAQAKIRPVVKDAENPHFKSDFATHKAILESIRAPMTEAGIVVLQAATSEAKTVTVTTRLAHAGQFYEADLSVELDKPQAQAVGSAVSYLKRYGLAALAGVATADDDDGEAAVGRGQPQNGAAKSAPQVTAQIDLAKRKRDALAWCDKALGDAETRKRLAHILGRTFPAGTDIKFQSEEELAKVEAWVELAKAAASKEARGE